MKRSKLLEYRIKRLERLMYEDEIDDFIADTERSVDDEIDDEYDGFPTRITYSTIDEFLDHEIMQRKLEPHGPYAEGVVKWLESFISGISHRPDSLDLIRSIQKDIKELHNVKAAVAQQKLLNALRKRLKIEKPQEEAQRNEHLNHWYAFIKELKVDLKDEIKRCTGQTYNVSYSSNQKIDYFKDLLSVDFIIKDTELDKPIKFNIKEVPHPRWDTLHLYTVTFKGRRFRRLERIDESEVYEQVAKIVCDLLDE